MNKADLVGKIAKEAAITKHQAELAFASFFGAVKSAMKKNQKVTMVGFGTFSSDGRPSRAFLWACPEMATVACVVSEPVAGFGNDFLKVPNKVTAEWTARVAEACA